MSGSPVNEPIPEVLTSEMEESKGLNRYSILGRPSNVIKTKDAATQTNAIKQQQFEESVQSPPKNGKRLTDNIY